jgi:hypothetical protein
VTTEKPARQPGGNEFYLRFANHESPLSGEWRVQAVSMLRLKVLASVVPLAIAAFFARGGLFVTSHPCIAIANTSVEMTDLPWHADLHVAFTEDPAAATVRVQITENADTADFAIVDDAETAEAGACEASPATRAISILDEAARGTPIIYLSHDGPADYRIFVRSTTFSQHDAAALVVGAGITGRTLQAASL